MEKLTLREVQELQLNVLKYIDCLCRKNNITYYLIKGSLLGAIRHGGFIPWDDDIDIAMMRDEYDRFLEICKKDLDDRYFLQNYHTDIDYAPTLSRICIKGTYAKVYPLEHLKFNKSTYIDIHPVDNVPDDDKLALRHEKQLIIIDKLINMKLYAVFDEGFIKYKRIIKRMRSLLLAAIPLEYLHSKREKVMKRYSNTTTKRVCCTACRYAYGKQIMAREIFGRPVLVKFEDGEFFAPEQYEKYLTQTYGDYMKIPPEDERDKPAEVYRL